MKKLRNKIKNELLAMRKSMAILKEWKWALAIAGVLLVACLALIRANFYYIDDQGRVVDGHMGWLGFSRYTTTIGAGILQMGSYMADLSPLTTLLAIMIMAVAGLIIIYTIKVMVFEKEIKWWDVIAVVIMGLSPYFMECFSYKFDAPFMALSVLASVIPFVFYKKSQWGFYGFTVIGTMVMCITYQASSGIFPMMVVVVAAAEWARGAKWRDLWKFVLGSGAAYLVTVVIFKEFLMIPQTLYVSNEVFGIGEMVPGVIKNLGRYYELVMSDARWVWLLISSVIIGEFVVVFTVKAQRNKIGALAMALEVVALLGIMAFGLYIVLVMPLTEMRAMYGIGVAIALLAVMVSSMAEKWILKVPAVVLTYNFVIFATTYGNMLAIQDTETKFRAEAIAMDLVELPALQTDEAAFIKVYGGIQQAKAIRQWTERTRAGALARLVPVQMRGDGWVWGQFYLFNNLELKTAISVEEDVEVDESWEKAVSNLYHDIYTKDNQVVVYIK